MRGALGATTISSDLSASQAFGLELLLTFVLVFIIFAATDPGRELRGYDIPLSIGVCVFICHMCGVGVEIFEIKLFSFHFYNGYELAM